MANDVSRPSQMQPAERDPYAEYAEEISSRPFVGDLLRFSKHGQYKAGQDQDVLPVGTRMFLYMPGLKRGWVKWWDQQPVVHMMGLVSEGYRPPPRDELGDLDEDQWATLDDKPIDPWQMTNHLPMCDTHGTVYTFASSSKGGLSEIGRISELYSQRRRMKPDEIPVIELQLRSYDHKLYGETMTPVFKVIGWAPIPTSFTELSATIDDSSDESLALEDLMQQEQEQEGDQEREQEEEEEEQAPARKPAARSAPPQKSNYKATPQKPVHKAAAPQKPAAKSAAKAPPSRNGTKAGVNGRRSPRL